MGSVILGLVTALMGLMLGITSLALEPVTEVREMPKEDAIKPKTVYYITGKESGGSYKGQERAFLERRPGAIAMSEADLNRWAADTFRFAQPTPEEQENAGLITMRPSAPNFRLFDGQMQIGLNVEVDAFGNEYKVRYFTTGYFATAGAGYAFIPTDSYMGSAHLPPQAVAPLFASTLFGVFQNTEQYPVLYEAWISLSIVSIDGDKLVLTR